MLALSLLNSSVCPITAKMSIKGQSVNVDYFRNRLYSNFT